MFGTKAEGTESTADDTGRGKVTLAACGETWSARLIGRKVFYTFSLGAGMQPLNTVCPLPLLGRVVAVGNGPSIVLENGDHLVWGRDGGWARQPVADTAS